MCCTRSVLSAFAVWLVTVSVAPGETLEVGPGRPFTRIEEANARARPGDVILVHPCKDGKPYQQSAVFVRERNLTFRGAVQKDGSRVKISGQGFRYSGYGSTPRAVFQFNLGSDNGKVEGFEIFGAHNDTHNAAGVRITEANRVTIRNCSIHGNDMGIMSNGDGGMSKGAGQRFESCEVYGNGDPTDPGRNHNLYLGGTDATLSFCDIHGSLTGHNIKSRTHEIRVEYCYVHDSANREFDLVDADETRQPKSHALLLGNVIVKSPNCRGNRNVIHFGQDGGNRRDGTLYLHFNTIVTPYVSPVVDLSSPDAKAELIGNLITDGGARQRGQRITSARDGADIGAVVGAENWFCGDYDAMGTRLAASNNRFDRAAKVLFVAPARGDYRLTPAAARAAISGVTLDQLRIPRVPVRSSPMVELPLAWQYAHPAGKAERSNQHGILFGALGP
jgi:hypothetical protein